VKYKFILGLALSLCCQLTSAQDSADADKDRKYVTDQLRLSLYEKASSKSKVIKLLQSGDLLVIDEIRGLYALVTEPDGSHGWVKRGFLVPTPTANIQLLEEREKNVSLSEEIERLSGSKIIIDTYEKDMDALVAKSKVLEAEKELAIATIARLQQELAEWQREEEELEPDQDSKEPAIRVLAQVFMIYWKIIVPALLALLALSFLISKMIVEARIRSKFHGIKIW
jgi:uncharacterized protein YgiM (DUF1202 family)